MAVLFVVAASRTAGASIIKTVGELIPKKHQEPGTKGRRRWGNGGGRGGAGVFVAVEEEEKHYRECKSTRARYRCNSGRIQNSAAKDRTRLYPVEPRCWRYSVTYRPARMKSVCAQNSRRWHHLSRASFQRRWPRLQRI